MRVLVCDDDLIFAEKVQKAVEIYYGARGIHPETVVCGSAEQVLLLENLFSYKLAFLDICLPKMNGIMLGRILKKKNPEIVLVYISGYLKYAPQGYTTKAFRYLLKDEVRSTLPVCLDEVYFEIFRKQKFLSAQINREICRIAFDSIYYLQSSTRQIHVFGENRTVPICTYYGKLADLPQDMFEYGFIRISRSAVVNMRYIKKTSAYKIQMNNDQELGISRSIYHTIRDAYREWKGSHEGI